ncbi:hypothetical protein HME7025_01818 [Aquirufa nivalisilvae]|uniref:Uncharacterized protein n=1 Tax=Aquirufa nivalisilvae TaxID=2516557 RepID=A0A2S2DXA7_9BACT|nr:hypothetical protein HME7025_01818 [Aquirufa nivalisilvae]
MAVTLYYLDLELDGYHVKLKNSLLYLPQALAHVV